MVGLKLLRIFGQVFRCGADTLGALRQRRNQYKITVRQLNGRYAAHILRSFVRHTGTVEEGEAALAVGKHLVLRRILRGTVGRKAADALLGKRLQSASLRNGIVEDVAPGVRGVCQVELSASREAAYGNLKRKYVGLKISYLLRSTVLDGDAVYTKLCLQQSLHRADPREKIVRIIDRGARCVAVLIGRKEQHMLILREQADGDLLHLQPAGGRHGDADLGVRHGAKVAVKRRLLRFAIDVRAETEAFHQRGKDRILTAGMVCLDGVLHAAIRINLQIAVNDVGRAVALHLAAQHVERFLANGRLGDLAELCLFVLLFDHPRIACKIGIGLEARSFGVINENVRRFAWRDRVDVSAVLIPLHRGRRGAQEGEGPVWAGRCLLSLRDRQQLTGCLRSVGFEFTAAAAQKRAQHQRRKQQADSFLFHFSRLLNGCRSGGSSAPP